MKLRMAENSLFAILLRKPWWVSALTALALLAFARFGVPPAWFFYAAPIALPFVVIACITGWRAMQAPSASRVAATDQAVRAMGAAEFGAALEQAWTREGWQVARIDDAGADFALTQGWRRSIASYRRWKVARTGIEPLRELAAARERREAHDAIYVAIGEVSDQAVAFARVNKIRILRADDLAKLLPPPAGGLLKRFSG
jgi:restriction system protein